MPRPIQEIYACAISYFPRPHPASRGRQALTGSSHPWRGAARFPIQQPAAAAGESGNPVESAHIKGRRPLAKGKVQGVGRRTTTRKPLLLLRFAG